MPGACLPLLISVPHGGLEVPPEVSNYCRLDLPALLKDGDTWAGYLYDMEDRVQAYFQFPVARAVIDLNRAADDRPPENPDEETIKRLTGWQSLLICPYGIFPSRFEFLGPSYTTIQYCV